MARLANRLEGWSSASAAFYRNMNTNVWYTPPSGPRVLVEVQVHFRDLHPISGYCHKAYDVTRAQRPEEVANLEPRKWAANGRAPLGASAASETRKAWLPDPDPRAQGPAVRETGVVPGPPLVDI